MKNKLFLSLLTLILIGCGGGGGGGGANKDPLSITTAGYTLSGVVPTVAMGVLVEVSVGGAKATIKDDGTWTATVAGPGTYSVILSVNSNEEVEKTVVITEN